MRLAEALAELGVDARATWPEVRDAYRRGMRSTHPDLAGPAGNTRAARLNEALRVVRAAHRSGELPAPEVPFPPPAGAPAPAPHPVVVDDESLVLVAPAGEVFDRLHLVLHTLGEVTYVDPHAGLLACLVELEGQPPALLTVALEDRAGTTTAAFTLESDGPGPVPRLTSIVRHVAAELRRLG